jgi:hypothetical protein
LVLARLVQARLVLARLVQARLVLARLVLGRSVPGAATSVRDTIIPREDTIVCAMDTSVLVRGMPQRPGRGNGSLAGRSARACTGDRLLVGDERRQRWHRVSVCHPAARCLEA